jgi:hypothetical protein
LLRVCIDQRNGAATVQQLASQTAGKGGFSAPAFGGDKGHYQVLFCHVISVFRRLYNRTLARARTCQRPACYRL